MLHHLGAQDAIIAAKTEQPKRTNRDWIGPVTSSRRINVGDYVLRNSNVIPKEDKPARKLLLAWIGPYKVLWHDATRTNYQLTLGPGNTHPCFHVLQIKLYNREPTNPQRCTFAISPTSLKISKLGPCNIPGIWTRRDVLRRRHRYLLLLWHLAQSLLRR
jgi:hypothetical protein